MSVVEWYIQNSPEFKSPQTTLHRFYKNVVNRLEYRIAFRPKSVTGVMLQDSFLNFTEKRIDPTASHNPLLF